MSMRVYKKHVRAAYPIVAYCGYCDLQYTLYFTPKFGHTERAEGWGCDVYGIAPDIALTTGYDPFGNRRLPLAFTERYEEKAKQILAENTYSYIAKGKLKALINELAAEIRTL
nr:MAG TPA: hypothetical protein [Bacteriophage sp.]